MNLKLLALGWREYTRSLKNWLDAVVTLATFVVVIVVYVPNTVSDARFIRLTLLLRLLRLLRVLDNFSIVRFVSSTFLATLPEARKLGHMMFIVLYFFSVLGLELFGGKINTDPAQPELALLANTTFAASDYYPMNFNDLASGFVTCFALLIVNNWYVLCDGFVAVTSPWARLYFVAFYAVGPLVCLNVVVAFCVEAFLAVMEDAKAEPDAGAEAVANGYCEENEHGCAHFDAAEVSGTQTGLEGIWRATMTAGPLPSRPIRHRSAILRNLLGSPNSA